VLASDPGIVALNLPTHAKAGFSVFSLGFARVAVRARHRMAKVPLDLDGLRITLVMRWITEEKGKRPKCKVASSLAYSAAWSEPARSPTAPGARRTALTARHCSDSVPGSDARCS
jgi:hypothetical protein